jgi:DNA-3-methyladenine glycosylase I
MEPVESKQARCSWCGTEQIYVDYHDNVWGRPVYDSLELFEKLCLDGQQAGLSWITILKKQANYQQAFAQFNPEVIAEFSEQKVEALMQDSGIVRN